MPVLETYDRIRVTTYPAVAVGGADAIATRTPADPFDIDSDCVSPSGHAPIVSCGDLVCRRCSKVLWL